MLVVNIRAVQCAEYQRQLRLNFNTYLIFKGHQDVKTYGGIETLLRALQIWALHSGKENYPSPFDRKLGGHHSRYHRSFEEIKMTACPENRLSIRGTRSLVTLLLRMNDLLHVALFSSKWQSASFYRTAAIYCENINAYEILKLASNKKNEVICDLNQKLDTTKKRVFLNTLSLSAF